MNKHIDNARIFKAFCDENRLMILEMLQSGEKCACVLLVKLKVGQSTLSHHMKILIESGIVSARKQGKWTYYSISVAGCGVAVKLLQELTVTAKNFDGGKKMKPKVNDKKCGANKNACSILKICPVEAISYIEVDEPINDKTVECETSSDCGCDCDCGDNSNSCEPNPYGRIIIDYDKCTECGICAEKCCGKAIETVD